jgi:hypothetical protein
MMGNPIQQQFNMFMQQMKGQDPNQILNQLLSTGRVSQNQINQAQQKANDMKNQLDNMKKFFGF